MGMVQICPFSGNPCDRMSTAKPAKHDFVDREQISAEEQKKIPRTIDKRFKAGIIIFSTCSARVVTSKLRMYPL